MNYINTLREGENFNEIYYCKNKTVAQNKNGKTYYSLTLQDKTATIDGKIWELNNAIEHFETGDYIQVSGHLIIRFSLPSEEFARLLKMNMTFLNTCLTQIII